MRTSPDNFKGEILESYESEAGWVVLEKQDGVPPLFYVWRVKNNEAQVFNAMSTARLCYRANVGSIKKRFEAQHGRRPKLIEEHDTESAKAPNWGRF